MISQALNNLSQHQSKWPSPLSRPRQLPLDSNNQLPLNSPDFHRNNRPTPNQHFSSGDPNSLDQQPHLSGASGTFKSLGYNAQLAGQQPNQSSLPVTRIPIPVNRQSGHQVVHPLQIPRSNPNQLFPRQDQRPISMSPDMLDMQNSPNDFGSPVFSGTYSAPGETLFDLPTTTISPALFLSRQPSPRSRSRSRARARSLLARFRLLFSGSRPL